MSAVDNSSFLFGTNSFFIEELLEKYKENPDSVDSSWLEFLSQLGVEKRDVASWFPEKKRIIGVAANDDNAAAKDKKPARTAEDSAGADSIRALMLIRAYRERGHTAANIDPLGIDPQTPGAELDPATYGFEEGDYDREIFLNGQLGMEKATLRAILTELKTIYCGNIGFEFGHINEPEQRTWIREKIESTRALPNLSGVEKEELLNTLTEVEGFEQFIHVKFTGTKRFSVEGGDSVIPALKKVIETGAQTGIEEVIVGMPHRGRLNVLTAVMGKPYSAMLSEFHGNLSIPEGISSSGDVKYHMGYSNDVEVAGKKVHLSLNANPSHLEAVNAVVNGKARAKQDQKKDTERTRVMSVLLHGDAAFAGQGTVAECFVLSDLDGYRTGGTVHIIVNNQIGFTTNPKKGRSSPYPSDSAKAVQAPIFHVNGDDPEAVLYVSKIATEFRQTFKKDVVIDLVCYRRYGHNEGDEPMFTQPLMYKVISDLPRTREIYANQLIAEKVIDDKGVAAKQDAFKDYLEEQFKIGKDYKPNKADWLEGEWSGLIKPERGAKDLPDTGVDLKALKEVGYAISKIPDGYEFNKKIIKLMENKKEMFDSGEGIDWATAEALAFGTLLKEKKNIRLSGQDCGRGTFSQRHSVLVDQNNESTYLPLNNLGGEQARYEVIDSALSEFAVLGFDYGYSLAEPNALTLWEAQFGDFVNGAQVVIDQFISSGEAKWLRMSGLVMLLPHGYEGQGPEHSSARLERFLQLCAEDNMQVANCTTSANYFHILRRQLHRNFRKPLIMMTPKSLLRKKEVACPLSDFAVGSKFKRIIPETDKLVADDKIRKVVICSGKVYYDIVEMRAEKKINDVAVIRVEQFYPFPKDEIIAEFKRYKNAEFAWCQEEPKNMGGWLFIRAFLDESLGESGNNKRVGYIGRLAAASPATGFLKVHNQEQNDICEKALG
ncbi:MAG: 2-oxoglutarate dehydrogenase E1 component [Alphaproteobacteria bacterium CG11_big_fil_rev_8_21_14_0_20_44_7]|nr:MAG: 2-oxoglutarate dehydrogenase E1 component [Alphaproteobacteria bacterium CG11_big_fil_rev_8_21_14_0_20_44_7]